MGGRQSMGRCFRSSPICFPPRFEPPPPPPPPPPKPPINRCTTIGDDYNSLGEVSNALAQAGLESSNLIVGIDFTKSNEWTGKISFHNRSLHHVGNYRNPYEEAIYIVGKTLASFDEDNLIPCFGFGDASTHDQGVFSFYAEGQPCKGFEDVLSRYRQLVTHVRFSGPTSFAPIIEMATSIVEKSGGQYHVLLIIADGQVTKSVNLHTGQLSTQEQRTYDAIVEASHFPLSIVLVGIGDGPWDTMKEFDDNIPSRAFDNFQFVNFTEIMSKKVHRERKEADFALAALMEVPAQYRTTIELGLLGHQTGKSPRMVSLPPPAPQNFESTSFGESAPHYNASTGPSGPSEKSDDQICPICLSNSRDMAFGCGHQTCKDCSALVRDCPICRQPIETRIKLY